MEGLLEDSHYESLGDDVPWDEFPSPLKLVHPNPGSACAFHSSCCVTMGWHLAPASFSECWLWAYESLGGAQYPVVFSVPAKRDALNWIIEF